MKEHCRYCGKDLPEPGMDGYPLAQVKGGLNRPIPVCPECIKKPANKLEIASYKKVTEAT